MAGNSNQSDREAHDGKGHGGFDADDNAFADDAGYDIDANSRRALSEQSFQVMKTGDSLKTKDDQPITNDDDFLEIPKAISLGSPKKIPVQKVTENPLETPKVPTNLETPTMPTSPLERARQDPHSIPTIYPTGSTILPARIPEDPTRPTSDDPNQRTVVVFDDYRNTDMLLKGGFGFSHGEVNARMAEEQGFNVVRVQSGLQRRGGFDLAGGLSDINKGIDDGRIPLKANDAVNASIALEASFERATRMLGMEVTPENVKEKRGEMLEAMRARSTSKEISPNDRAFLKQALSINEEVMKLQDRGIKVFTAAGNRGPGSFNIGMLTADKQYSAADPDGKTSSYSSKNSLTTDGPGNIDFYAMPVSIFDSKPFEQQTGHYRVGGTNIFLDAKDFGGFLDTTKPNPETTRVLMSANPGVNIPLEMNIDAWRTGNLTLSVQGTSFVNGYRLPIDIGRAEKSE